MGTSQGNKLALYVSSGISASGERTPLCALQGNTTNTLVNRRLAHAQTALGAHSVKVGTTKTFVHQEHMEAKRTCLASTNVLPVQLVTTATGTRPSWDAQMEPSASSNAHRRYTIVPRALREATALD